MKTLIKLLLIIFFAFSCSNEPKEYGRTKLKKIDSITINYFVDNEDKYYANINNDTTIFIGKKSKFENYIGLSNECNASSGNGISE